MPTNGQTKRTIAPPRPPFALAVGMTGHRSDALGDGADAAIRSRLETILAQVAAAAEAVRARHAACFDPGPSQLRLVSPLADGADQIAAEAALAAGFTLQAVLPFAREDYLADFTAPAALAGFETLVARATCVLELPGDRARPLEAYIMAGRATVAHSDILIAVWDGVPARGRGGTGEVVEHARRRGTPVIHLPTGEGEETRIIWSGFDPLIAHSRLDEIPARALDAESIALLMTALLAPPADPRERAYLTAFQSERERLLRPRIEYPLLLALTGAKPLRRSAVRVGHYADTVRGEWATFHDCCSSGSHGVSPALDPIEAAYCWTDGLAQHFAQTYRSGHVFNFVLAGASVVVALATLLAPDLKIALSIAELLLVLALIVNTHIGTRGEWHRRWLDYRQLAERLRPMRTLLLLGLAQPGFAEDTTSEGKRRWIDWYAAAVWRAVACPAGRITANKASALANFLSAEELRPQIDWHRAGAGHMLRLDHRLHAAGTALFIATIVSTALYIAGYYLWGGWTAAQGNLFVFLSGGLPAVGTAIFGIRVQGDFAGTASRSIATADGLERIAADVEKGVGLTRSADLFEQAARVMLADLGQWRLVHQQRKLVIPA